MQAQQMDDVLTKTLTDARLSGGEKHALSGLVADLQANEHQLALFRSRAFQLAVDAVGHPEARQIIGWLEDVVKVLQAKTHDAAQPAYEVCVSPGDDCVGRIVNLLRYARQTADICVYTITDNRIAEAMIDAQRRGVAVRVITDAAKEDDLGSDIGRFRLADIPVRINTTEYLMHHKFALFDDTQLLNGSYNWTRSAATVNRENFIVTNDRRLVGTFRQVFEDLWQQLG